MEKMEIELDVIGKVMKDRAIEEVGEKPRPS